MPSGNDMDMLCTLGQHTPTSYHWDDGVRVKGSEAILRNVLGGLIHLPLSHSPMGCVRGRQAWRDTAPRGGLTALQHMLLSLTEKVPSLLWGFLSFTDQ